MSFRLVLVSQESTRPAALEAALREQSPPAVELRTFPAAALTTDPDAVATAAASADLLLLTHLLTEDTVAAALRLLDGTVRPDTHVLVLQSLRELLLRTRLGGKGLLEIVRGTPFAARLEGEGDLSGSFRTMLQKLPFVLQLVPAERGDLRTFLETMLYWREPTPVNMRGLALMLADRWSATPGVWSGRYEAPVVYPDVGLWHPACGITEDPAEIPAPEPCTGSVGLLVMRGAVLAEDTAAAAELTQRLEARGLRVVPAFAESFDFRAPIERWFDPAGVDAIVAMTGFPLVGGHNQHEGDASAEFLAARNTLYFTPPSLMTQDTAQWSESRLGLSPMENAMQLAIHEAEGGIEPIVLQGARVAGGTKEAIADRAERFADRVAAWVRLRKRSNADKRVGLTLFSFPPGKGSVGTAAYLDVFKSAHAILTRLAAEGYTVDVPKSPEELLALVVTGDDKRAPLGGADLAVAARLAPREYEALVPEWRRMTRQWGDPPGSLNSDGRDLLVHGVELGNVFVGVQPSFGYEGDPMRLLFEPSATPHHGFVAYYRWLERVFGADAVLHLGTHGALEFMPGKQTGLSAKCWPDALIGGVPDIYVYAVNNPSEGTIAKRRGLAVTVGHLTPPLEHAGLYRELDELRAMLADYHSEADGERRQRTGAVLVERARALSLDRDVALPQGDADLDAFADRLAVHLREIAARRIPVGLHVVGRRPQPDEATELLAAIADHDRPELGVRSLPRLLLEAKGEDAAAIDRGIRAGEKPAVDAWGQAAECTREIVGKLSDEGGAQAEAARFAPAVDARAVANATEYLRSVAADLEHADELAPVVDALAGRFVRPGPGGDPVRTPAVLPTGRNLHALDPASVPSEVAMRHAAEAVDLLLARQRRELGAWPRRIGMVLWGLDNIKTHGEAIAQAFLLLGTRPRKNSIGRMAEIEVIPLAELGRPRIDVMLNTSGIFRDIFGVQMDLLDRAVRAVAALDEPLEQNYVRASVTALSPRFGAERAVRRVFSNEPGAYGTNVDQMVVLSAWRERADIARVWRQRKGFTFGADGDGLHDADLLEALAAGVDTTYQNLDSSEVSLIDVDHYFEYLGGMGALVEATSGQKPAAVVADTTTATPRMRSLEETIRLETRTKLLNPRWYEGMLRHGYEGVEEVRKRCDYTFGWSATSDAVDPWVYREVYRTFVADEAVSRRMREANVHSFQAIVGRLAEADGRGFWEPTAEEHARLRAMQELTEDQLEGVPG